MRLRDGRFRLGAALAGTMLILIGCFGGVFYKKAGVIGGGYHDKKLSPGVYEIYYFAPADPYDMAKYGALYRASEIAYENKYQYYKITKEENQSQDAYFPGANAGAGYRSSHSVILINIKLSHTLPKGGYDAFHMLDHNEVPGTDGTYTRAQRKADAKKAKEEE